MLCFFLISLNKFIYLHYFSINYKNYGQENHIWDINTWKTDVINELKRYNSVIESISEQKLEANTIIVCYSAASQAVLRALLALKKLSNAKLEPAGILMISPGIGMNVESYVERLMPGTIESLKSGKTLNHPSNDPTVHIKINYDCLADFVNVCFF